MKAANDDSSNGSFSSLPRQDNNPYVLRLYSRGWWPLTSSDVQHMNTTRIRMMTMFAACLAATAAPNLLSAQIGGTLGKILNGLGKVAKTPPPIQLVGKPLLQGGDTTVLARFRVDTATTRIAAPMPAAPRASALQDGTCV